MLTWSDYWLYNLPIVYLFGWFLMWLAADLSDPLRRADALVRLAATGIGGLTVLLRLTVMFPVSGHGYWSVFLAGHAMTDSRFPAWIKLMNLANLGMVLYYRFFIWRDFFGSAVGGRGFLIGTIVTVLYLALQRKIRSRHG